ncbi:hypothetical protein ACEZCY_29280 [Streptacidiphilus sp. N1-12]|uniref:Uncharacterized protein n=2 Tax=Streptacidiphilus alkalitolerans TaxID=3342712 RepID=A0ABV6VHL8_9ACTN
MDEFNQGLVARVQAARRGVQEAVASHNPAAVSTAVDELEDALRSARENGLEVPPTGAEDAAAARTEPTAGPVP